jgi:hypothetical protein
MHGKIFLLYQLKQMERSPQPGQIWKHFKGNDYEVLLITGIPLIGTNNPDLDILRSFWSKDIKHSETQETLTLITELSSDNVTTTHLMNYQHELPKVIKEPHVIYRRCDRAYPDIWARPMDNFLDILTVEQLAAVQVGKHNLGFGEGLDYRFTRIS